MTSLIPCDMVVRIRPLDAHCSRYCRAIIVVPRVNVLHFVHRPLQRSRKVDSAMPVVSVDEVGVDKTRAAKREPKFDQSNGEATARSEKHCQHRVRSLIRQHYSGTRTKHSNLATYWDPLRQRFVFHLGGQPFCQVLYHLAASLR
jgi:hypothetical protein